MGTIIVGEDVVVENFDEKKQFYTPDHREEELHREAKFDAIDAEKVSIIKAKERYGEQQNIETNKHLNI